MSSKIEIDCPMLSPDPPHTPVSIQHHYIVEITAEINQNITLSPSQQYNPYTTYYQWYNGTGLPIPDANYDKLFIRPVREEDYGFYKLYVWDKLTKLGQFTDFFEVKRPFLKPSQCQVPFIGSNNGQAYTRGRIGDIELPCQENEFSSSTYQPVRHSSYVPATQSASARSPKHSKPKLLQQLTGEYYRQGNNVRFFALFENATEYFWYKDGSRIQGCSGSNLWIRNANKSNNGHYMVSARNPYYGAMESTESVELIVA